MAPTLAPPLSTSTASTLAPPPRTAPPQQATITSSSSPSSTTPSNTPDFDPSSVAPPSSSRQSSIRRKFGTVSAGLSSMTTNTAKKNGKRGRGVMDSSIFSAALSASNGSAVGAGAGADSADATLRPVETLESGEGVWSVSVADGPSKRGKTIYTIYCKTPTHNLTLTRAASAIQTLDASLREALPDHPLPTLTPLSTTTLSAPGSTQSRRRSFLNTLSRIANPSTNNNNNNSPSLSAPGSTKNRYPLSPPLSPCASSPSDVDSSVEVVDTPAPPVPEKGKAAPTSLLGAYLTALANDPTVRQTKSFRRFTRVRVDDLQSARVERRIKRVRSDLATHTSTTNTPTAAAAGGSGPAATSVQPTGMLAPPMDRDHGASSVSMSSSMSTSSRSVSGTSSALPDVDEDADAEAEMRDMAEMISQLESSASAAETSTELPDAPSPAPPAGYIPGRPASADPDRASARRSRDLIPADIAAFVAYGQQQQAEEGENEREREREREERERERKARRERRRARKVKVEDFEMMRVLGKGCAGKVLLVRHRQSQNLYAMKAIHKRHVLAHQELQHTLTEQTVLKRMAKDCLNPFVVQLHYSFHDEQDLFLVMDFHPGGDLATQLSRWGRLGRDRARFYAAEIVEGVEGLHAAGVIYRDLKPENILIAADGHIILTDFGLSKEFPRPGPADALPAWMTGTANSLVSASKDSTTSFCGTAEYLAPEVIQGLQYSYEVDWWSLGTMLYEMLAGITPFWAANHSDMYVKVLHDELQFGDERYMDQDTKSLLRGLLQKNPALRLCEPRIKKHPYFGMLDWDHIAAKRYIPPYIPPTNPHDDLDTQNFDETFLDMEPVIDDEDLNASNIDPERAAAADQAMREADAANEDLFERYSYRRHGADGSSIMLEDEDDEDTRRLNVLEPAVPEGATTPTATDGDTTLVSSPDPKAGLEAHPPRDASSSQASDPSVQVIAPPAPPPPLQPEVVELHPATKRPRRRREKSGVAALDRALLGVSNESDADENDADEENALTDLDEEDDDWDLVESDAPMEHNGRRQGANLFARGIPDRYRLLIRRQSSNHLAGGAQQAGSRPMMASRSTSQASIAPTDEGTSATDIDAAPARPPPSRKTSGGGLASSLNLRKKRTAFLSRSRAASPTPATAPTSLKSKSSSGGVSNSASTRTANASSEAENAPAAAALADGGKTVKKKKKVASSAGSPGKEKRDIFAIFKS